LKVPVGTADVEELLKALQTHKRVAEELQPARGYWRFRVQENVLVWLQFHGFPHPEMHGQEDGEAVYVLGSKDQFRYR
jgi:hypothetical protein